MYYCFKYSTATRCQQVKNQTVIVTVGLDSYFSLPSGYKVEIADRSYFGVTNLPTLHFHSLRLPVRCLQGSHDELFQISPTV